MAIADWVLGKQRSGTKGGFNWQKVYSKLQERLRSLRVGLNEAQPVVSRIYETTIVPLLRVFGVGVDVTLWTFKFFFTAVHGLIRFVFAVVVFLTAVWYLLSADDAPDPRPGAGGGRRPPRRAER